MTLLETRQQARERGLRDGCLVLLCEQSSADYADGDPLYSAWHVREQQVDPICMTELPPDYILARLSEYCKDELGFTFGRARREDCDSEMDLRHNIYIDADTVQFLDSPTAAPPQDTKARIAERRRELREER